MKKLLMLPMLWMCFGLLIGVMADDNLPALAANTAAQWEAAADAGSESAAKNLADAYDRGAHGLKKNDTKAFKYLKMAADRTGYGYLVQLGHFYMTGRGCKKDYQKAADCYRRAGEAGVDWGWAKLSELYEKGLGVKKDYAEMRRLCELAAEKDNQMALVYLGRIYENGMGVEKNVAEAVKWYKKCAGQRYDQFGFRKQARARLEVLDPADKMPFDPAKIDGDELLKKMSDVVSDARRLDVTMAQLKGREYTMTGLQVEADFSWLFKKDTIDLSRHVLFKPKNNGKRKTPLADNFFESNDPRQEGLVKLSVNFPKDLPEGVGADTYDNFDSVTVRVEGFIESDKKLMCTVTACVPAKPEHELPAFDAATITGGELATLLQNVKITGRQRYELQRRLAGRKLSFVPVAISCDRNSRNSKIRRWRFHAKGGKKDIIGDVEFCFACSDDKTNSMLQCVSERRGMEIVELTATVAQVEGGAFKRARQTRKWLELSNPQFRFEGKLAEIPDADFSKMTGEEVGKALSNLRGAVSKTMFSGLLDRVAGRELSFTELFVEDVDASTTNEMVEVICRTCRKNPADPGKSDVVEKAGRPPQNYGLKVAVPLPMALLEAMPRDPVKGDTLVGVVGRVEKKTNNLRYNDWRSDVLRLEQVSSCKLRAESPGRMPENLEKLSGDEILASINAESSEMRQALFTRLCRQCRRSGRRLSFSHGKLNCVEVKGGNVEVVLSLCGNEYKVASRLPMGPAAEAILNLGVGDLPGPVSGVLALNLTDRSFAVNSVIADVKFDFAVPKTLPSLVFDEKTITGDELVKMLQSHKGKLTAMQKIDLVKRLAGRRLTFDLEVDFFTSILSSLSSFKSAHLNRIGDCSIVLVDPVGVDLGLGKKRITGTVKVLDDNGYLTVLYFIDCKNGSDPEYLLDDLLQ